jgi:hypothetical protein
MVHLRNNPGMSSPKRCWPRLGCDSCGNGVDDHADARFMAPEFEARVVVGTKMWSAGTARRDKPSSLIPQEDDAMFGTRALFQKRYS